MNEYREFWDVPVADVPGKTGAVNATGVDDIREVLAALGLDLGAKNVVDVGCGTGRLAELCHGYVGVDVAPGMVEYAQSQGHEAFLIAGPADLDGFASDADIVCSLSVFTHISREERKRYLAAFRELAPELLVDILPAASEGGAFHAWYAHPASFESDLTDTGWAKFDSFDRTSGDGELHRYYHCVA